MQCAKREPGRSWEAVDSELTHLGECGTPIYLLHTFKLSPSSLHLLPMQSTSTFILGFWITLLCEGVYSMCNTANVHSVTGLSFHISTSDQACVRCRYSAFDLASALEQGQYQLCACAHHTDSGSAVIQCRSPSLPKTLCRLPPFQRGLSVCQSLLPFCITLLSGKSVRRCCQRLQGLDNKVHSTI